MRPESGRQLASRDLLFDHGLPSGIGHLRFVSFCQPEVVAVSTAVDRVRLAVVFHQNGCNLIKLESPLCGTACRTFFDPERFAPS